MVKTQNLRTILMTAALYGSVSGSVFAAPCDVFQSSGSVVELGLDDPLFKTLKRSVNCPKDVTALRSILGMKGAGFFTTMVANRGFHNPGAGSFSFFETVEVSGPPGERFNKDELFIGHFTAPKESALTLDQNQFSSGLMIEAMAWDSVKEVYNFYELVGSPQGSKWFYRGDSADVWSDVAKLHLNRLTSEPIFGSKLRCSGCHISGGPIMKELSEPHDSWWKSKRPLPLGGRVPDNETLAIMQTLSEPKDLRESVISGLDKLFSGKKFREKVLASPQIALRPLFCPEEVNLQSDLTPLESERADVVVPTDFFIDQRLLSTNHMLHIAKTDYMEGLRTLGSKFPEIHALDGDHAWLSPVKATSDILAVAKLVEEGLIEDKLVLDVLGVDMTRPVFSKKRCELLQLVPDQWSLDWKDDFQKNLKLSRSESTKILLQNMAEEPNGMQKNVDSFMESCHGQLSNNSSMLALVRYLDQTRKEIASSEISKNRNGQILEPGFRVIFPKFEKSAEVAWGRTLNESCQPK